MITTILAVIALINTVLLFALYGKHVKLFEDQLNINNSVLEYFGNQGKINNDMRTTVVAVVEDANANFDNIQNAFRTQNDNLQNVREAVIEIGTNLGYKMVVDKATITESDNVISINFPKLTESPTE